MFAGGHLCIVMELAENGDLASYMEQMSVLSVRLASTTMHDQTCIRDAHQSSVGDTCLVHAKQQASLHRGLHTVHVKFVSVPQVPGMAEDEARYIFQQLLVAMDYCHRIGIANRDIKVLLPGRLLP